MITTDFNKMVSSTHHNHRLIANISRFRLFAVTIISVFGVLRRFYSENLKRCFENLLTTANRFIIWNKIVAKV